MSRYRAFAAATLSLVILAGSAFSQEQDKPKRQRKGGPPSEAAMKERIKEAFKKGDEDKDGALTQEEFGKAMASFRTAAGGPRAKAGGEGKGARKPGKGGSAKKGTDRTAEMFRRADADSNGKVNEEEFTKAINAMRERAARRSAGKAGPEGGEGKKRPDPLN